MMNPTVENAEQTITRTTPMNDGSFFCLMHSITSLIPIYPSIAPHARPIEMIKSLIILLLIWLPQQDSNLHSSDSESAALPIMLQGN